MALASLFGGLALANAGLGAVHGLAGAIGACSRAPRRDLRGAAAAGDGGQPRALCARAPRQPGPARYQEVARLLTGRSSAPANDGVEWVARLVSDLQIPKLGALRPDGATRRRIRPAKSKNASSMKANPIVLTRQELAAVVEGAI